MAESDSSRPTVYIVQEMKRLEWDEELQRKVLRPVHDLTPAAVYGELKTLMDGRPIGLNFQRMISELRDKLREFSEKDFILPTGDPIAMGIAIHLAAERNFGRVKVLRWDGRARAYVEAQVDFKKSRIESSAEMSYE